MNILIVEDSEIEAVLLAKTLQKIMKDTPDISHVDTIGKAQEFLKDRKTKIDLVFLDLGLPDTKDWHETYEVISLYTDRFPVIVMTSNKSHEVVEELLKNGIEDYIVKGSKRHDADLLKEAIEFALLRHKVVDNLSKGIKEKDQYVHWLTGGYSVE